MSGEIKQEVEIEKKVSKKKIKEVTQEEKVFQRGDKVRVIGEPKGWDITGKIINFNSITKGYRVNGVAVQRNPKGVIQSSSPISKILSGTKLELIKEPI